MEYKIFDKDEREEIEGRIGKKIQEIRKKKVRKIVNGQNLILRQSDFSQIIHKPTRFINSIEKNTAKQPLDVFTFINICNALNTTSNSILSDFITDDLENTSFNKIDMPIKEIIKELIDVISDNSDTGITHNIEHKPFNKQILRQRIKKFREDKNMTARELSSKLKKSHSYINNIETGNSSLTIPAMIELCNTLDVTPNDLLQPFLTTNKLTDYNNLNSENKAIVDSLIRICNQKQQKIGYISKRIATPEEMAKYNIKPKFSRAEQNRYYSDGKI